jgi:hypothetical protein
MPPTRSVCDGATGGDHADVGPADRAEPGDLAEPAHPHLEDEHLGVERGAEDRHRQALLVVEAALVGRDRRPAPTAARTRSLVLVLPTLPVIPTTLAVSRSRAQDANAMRATPVSATSTTVSGVSTGRDASVAAAPAAAAAAMKSCPSRSATRGTKSWPATSERESNEAPSTSTSAPRRVPPVASATSDARILTGPNGTVQVMAADRIHLVVLFGGQSAEHDVSCVTAAHVLAAVDPRPTGSRRSASAARASGSSRTAPRPRWEQGRRRCRRAGAGRELGVGEAVLGQLDEPGERTVVLPLLHGPMGEDGTVQGLLELADIAYVGAGVLGSALAMDKAMAKQVLAANGIAQSPLPGLRRARPHARPAQ